MRALYKFAAAFLLALSLFAFVFAGYSHVSSPTAAFAAEAEEDCYTYDDDIEKWLFTLYDELDVTKDYLGTWNIYLCFDERPTYAFPYVNRWPVGILFEWPSTRYRSTSLDPVYYTPGVARVVYCYDHYATGKGNRLEYMVGSVSYIFRRDGWNYEDKGDRLYVEIESRNEFAESYVSFYLGQAEGTMSTVRESSWVFEARSSGNFVVDLTAPEIETGGEYRNELEIEVSDEVAGIEAVFVAGPGEETYSVAADLGGATAATVTVPATENGEYRFFAADMCGNCSEIYSVYLDTVSPILTVTETEDEFFLSATDDTGSVCRILDAEGNVYSDELSVAKDFVGEKTYWAVDEAGNVSKIATIAIVLMYPYGALIPTEDEAYYFTWDDPGGIAMLDGEPYEKDTVVTKEGNHLIEFQTTEKDVYTYSFEVGHFYYESYREDPTCQAEGYVRYDCAHCDDFYTETLEQLEHSFYSYEASATCEEGGYIRYTCMYCGESYTFETSSATGHVYLPATSTATCTSPGGTTYTCIFCGDSYVVGDGVLADHDYVVTEVFQASCEEPGYRILECVNCGDERVDMINPLGHEYYLASEVKDGDGNVVRTYTCTRCGESYTQTLGDTQNSTAKAIIDIFERYQKYMWWVLLAVAAVWGAFLGIRYAVTADDEGHAKARRAVWNFAVGIVVIAVVLVGAPYLVYGIALLLS